MPIEIKELSINIQVSSQQPATSIHAKDLEKIKQELRHEILKECMEKVLEILEQQNQR